jgi:outer membrane protein
MNVYIIMYKKSMRNLFAFCLAFEIIIGAAAFAQTKDTAKYVFTLQQAIDYAVKNQYSMKNATLDEAIANAKVGETRGIGLPQISGSVQYLANDPLRRMYFEIDPSTRSLVSGFFGVPPANLPPNGTIITAPNFFQLPVSMDGGLSITQILFNSSYLIGLKAAETYRELSSKSTEMTHIQVVENVTKAYYMVLVNKERLELFDKNVIRVDSLLAETQAMNQQGMVELVDVQRLQVTENSIHIARENFKNLLDLSLLTLKYQLSMPLSNELILTQRIAEFNVDAPDDSKLMQMNYENRIEYSLLETQKHLNELNLKNNSWSAMPSLSAFGNLGYSTQNVNVSGITNTDLYYGYGTLGVTMNIPIFSGFQRSYRIQQSKLTLQKSENDLANLALGIDVQIKSAAILLKNGISTLGSQKKNMELSAEVARVTKTKYADGVGTSLEVNTAESDLVNAQTNYFNALYDALVAKVDYLKAVGKLK